MQKRREKKYNQNKQMLRMKLRIKILINKTLSRKT